jgi:hypothetical protein
MTTRKEEEEEEEEVKVVDPLSLSLSYDNYIILFNPFIILISLVSLVVT